MSHRFPPIAAQSDYEASSAPASVRALAKPRAPSLPWMEVMLGVAFLILLRGL